MFDEAHLLGNRIASALERLGARKCPGCDKRRRALNAMHARILGQPVPRGCRGCGTSTQKEEITNGG